MKAHGFDFDPEWLREAFEFRCPVLGTMDVAGGALEFRRAFESWPLMAEQSRGSATVRVVDNSSDRIQVSTSAPELLDHGLLLVNGVEVPFRKVGKQMVCGIRYKCASAYPALHPHVPIQSPLHLEWVERHGGKTLQAVRYFYWNPDGPVYERRPADPEEAARRRQARWQRADDLIGREPQIRKPEQAPEYRYTLDLRRQARG